MKEANMTIEQESGPNEAGQSEITHDGAASSSVETAEREAIGALVEAWFVEQVHNSPVSRDTVIFNHLRVAVDILKARIAAL
jgi:hypothetical protein